jgi:hypothetical protein
MSTREELYSLVWTTPVSLSAQQFSVSGSYMARVCTALDVPRPPRGYWARRAAGRASPRPSLPRLRPGIPKTWIKGQPLDKSNFRSRLWPQSLTNASIAANAGQVHPLVSIARNHLILPENGDHEPYVRPRKKVLSDLTVTGASAARALDFANALFLGLEARGYFVVIAPPFENLIRCTIETREDPDTPIETTRKRPWSPARPTVVYVGTVPIGLAIVETTSYERMRYIGHGRFVPVNSGIELPDTRVGNSWITRQQVPTGHLKLVAYSPFHRVHWQTEWPDTFEAPVENQVGNIINDIESAAAILLPQLHKLVGVAS